MTGGVTMMRRSHLVSAAVIAAVAFTGVTSASAGPIGAASSDAVARTSSESSIVQTRSGRHRAFAAGAAVAGIGVLAGVAAANAGRNYNQYGYAEPYYYEPPAYYAPPPVYYEPAPVYQPRVYYSAPYGHYYGPRGTYSREFNYR
jgi:hypothetical protein